MHVFSPGLYLGFLLFAGPASVGIAFQGGLLRRAKRAGRTGDDGRQSGGGLG